VHTVRCFDLSGGSDNGTTMVPMVIFSMMQVGPACVIRPTPHQPLHFELRLTELVQSARDLSGVEGYRSCTTCDIRRVVQKRDSPITFGACGSFSRKLAEP
jgi:hypothetical protein